MTSPFLIQTINGKIKHDFSFVLREAIEYQNFFGTNLVYTTAELEDAYKYRDYIPIGSVEFVCKYFSYHYNLQPKPKNVPLQLFDYAQRDIFNGTVEHIKENKSQFIKSNDKIKGFSDIVTSKKDIPIGNYQISNVIEIDSEYRVFVFRNKAVGMKNYAGDFFIFPNTDTIQRMIEDYKEEAPIAYTLDIGINKTGTFIIEVHDFFSCGLYGFSNYNILSQMFSSWFYEYLRNNL